MVCKCGAEFDCQPSLQCWCNQLPPFLSTKDQSTCLCQTCLFNAIKEAAASISVEQVEAFRHLPKKYTLIDGIDYYEENGFFVFTKWYHIRRGYCCKSGCRHCPYGYVKNA